MVCWKNKTWWFIKVDYHSKITGKEETLCDVCVVVLTATAVVIVFTILQLLMLSFGDDFRCYFLSFHFNVCCGRLGCYEECCCSANGCDVIKCCCHGCFLFSIVGFWFQSVLLFWQWLFIVVLVAQCRCWGSWCFI